MNNTTQELDGYLDLFSGYGGFHKAIEEAGFSFKNTYFSEIDKYAIANYSYNYPNSQYAGPIQSISGTTIGKLDLVTFGWPCQDNSIAGKRKGQQPGTRSGLLYEAVRIVNEFKPRNFIAENVKGLYSVNVGVDFKNAVEVLAYLNESMPQYDIEMQLCNTRWVLPQNRERLFFIGHLITVGGSGQKVFPIGEGAGMGDRPSTTSKEIHEPAQTMTARQYSSWNGNYVALTETRTDEARDIRRENMKNGRDFSPRRGKELTPHTDGVMNTLTGTQTKEHLILNIPSNTTKGYDEVREGDSINLSMPNSTTRRGRVGKGVAQTLDTSCNQGVIQVNKSTESGGKQPYQQNRVYNPIGDSPALNTDGRNLKIITHYGHKDKDAVIGDISPTLKAQSHGHEPMTITSGNIRRLTPIECERLQGLPDDWTKFGSYAGCVQNISDSQRYRLCGNGVSVPIVKVIAKRLFDLNYKS